jgi:hypothetical protein
VERCDRVERLPYCTRLLGRLQWSKVWGVCPWFDRATLRWTVDGNEARYATAVVQVWGSQDCMGQYIQKRLNSGQGEGRLKAAGGKTEIGRPLWHWALALLPVPAAVKPRLAGFIFTREENDEIQKIYRRRSFSHSLVLGTDR